MRIFRRIAQKEPLFRGMADRLGIDFGAWITRNPELAGDYRAAVISCAACSSGADCQAWQSGTSAAAHAPGFCRNRHMLEALTEA